MDLETLNNHFYQLIAFREAAERLAALRSTILSAQQLDGIPAQQKNGDRITGLVISLDLQEQEVERLSKGLETEQKQILRFLRTIPDNKTKLIFSLRFVAGLTWAEVGRILRISAESAKMACYRFFQSDRAQP